MVLDFHQPCRQDQFFSPKVEFAPDWGTSEVVEIRIRISGKVDLRTEIDRLGFSARVGDRTIANWGTSEVVDIRIRKSGKADLRTENDRFGLSAGVGSSM